MKIYNKTLLSFCVAVILTSFSCSKLLVEPDPKGDAAKNFQIFWSDLNNTYPYFSRDKVDWQSLYNENVKRINDNTSVNELFDILKDMLRPLNDGHIQLKSPSGEYWNNEKFTAYYFNNIYNSYGNYKGSLKNYLTHEANYVTSENLQEPGTIDTVGTYGIVRENLLYYHVQTYYTNYSFEKSISEILQANTQIKGIILDVRDNTGGNVRTMLNLMSIFFPGVTTYAFFKEKVGPLENDFSSPVNYDIFPNKTYPYVQRPVVVLTNRFTFSAGEHTVLAMKERPNTTIVGDTTGGGLSFIVQRTLPNGILYTAVSSQTYDMDKNLYEGLGIPPQVSVELPRSSFLEGKDNLIEKAIEILQ